MRAFIGLNLPHDILLKLSGLQTLLKETHADVTWVKQTNLHITLKFLGEINSKQLKKVCLALKKTAEVNHCFMSNLAELGVFPDARSIRLIWVGLDQKNQKIKQLAASLEDALEELKLAQEKRGFSAHITIGRVRSGLNLNKLSQEINTMRLYFADTNTHFKIDKITLFESRITACGLAYEALEEVNLRIS